MRVLLVAHQYLPRHVTGTEQYVRTVARGLRAAGVDARVFAFEPLLELAAPGHVVLDRDEVVEDVPVHRIGVHDDLLPNFTLRDFENPMCAALFGRHLDAGIYDAVHVFHLRNLGVGVLREARVRDVPVFVHLMDFWFVCANYLLWHRDGALCAGPPEGGFGCIRCVDPPLADAIAVRGLGPALRQIGDLRTPATDAHGSALRQAHALMHRKEHLFEALGLAELLIAPSRFLMAEFERQGVPSARLRHLPYGLDPERFEGMPPRKREPGLPHLDVGYVGSISQHKGVLVLLEAMQRVAGDRIRLHVYGRRESEPGFSEPIVDGWADPRVIFHGPFAPTDLGQVLAGLDVLVVPSLWYENTPFSVLEALHVGLPVVASDRGGIREIVIERKNGWLFPAGDPAALAAILAGLVADPSQLRVPPTVGPTVADNVSEFRALYEAARRTSGASGR